MIYGKRDKKSNFYNELLQNTGPLLTCLDDSNVIIIQMTLKVNQPLLDVDNKAQETLK